MIKRKNGFFLAEETLKIIIAVIVIIFLAYFLYSLYSSNKDAENLKFAQSSLNYLLEQINAKSENVQIDNPDSWTILSWPFEDKRPLSCSNLGWKNCICICKETYVEDISNYLDNCEETGSIAVCAESDFVVHENGNSQLPIVIQDAPIMLKIDYTNKKISKI